MVRHCKRLKASRRLRLLIDNAFLVLARRLALGTAAQDAALKQASAQLQAGTLEQQTQTAQKQALCSEFQKERMYPLQTAQLYAQTAGALGPLMGSTSMGYQQMPFFGGFAADGGAIKGYDEGLGAARMGGSVEEPGDYSRGGYAYGGIGAHLNYTDMADSNAVEKRKMDALLASQQASFAPSSDTSGKQNFLWASIERAAS